MKYNRDQETYIKNIEKSEGLTTTVVVGSSEFEYTRPIDRPRLNLNKQIEKIRSQLPKKKSVVIESEDYESNSESEDDRMVELINMWWGKRKIIAKVLSFLYENEDTNEEELKEFIEECGSKNVDKMYNELIRKDKKFTSVFQRKNNITNLTKEARDYIDEME